MANGRIVKVVHDVRGLQIDWVVALLAVVNPLEPPSQPGISLRRPK